MSYSIRYDSARRENIFWSRRVRCALAMLALCVLARIFGRSDWMKGILTCEQMNLTEQAIVAAARSLAAGEGWYRVILAWCGTVIGSGI